MVTLEVLLLACAIAAPDATGDPVLLEFTSTTCGPCRSMQPVLDRLHSDGYPVRQIDVGKYPDLARRYRVSSVPCFVMLVADQEVDRVVGMTSQARLLRMFQAAANPNLIRGQSPDGNATDPDAFQPLGSPRSGGPPADLGNDPASPEPEFNSDRGFGQPRGTAQRQALAATVRITVEDAKGNSIATGTIIDSHGDEALVVTCGHVFRESQGRGKIRVDLHGQQGVRTVEAHYLTHEVDDPNDPLGTRKADIGLIAIRPGESVSPVRVAPAGYRAARGDRAFSIGCDHGAPPSIRETSISAINKYLGAPNIEAVGQPVEGRSGGGLFSSDGHLIGVCYAADAEDNEGLYTALATIHQQLAAIGLEHLYQQPHTQFADVDGPSQRPAGEPNDGPSGRPNALLPPLAEIGPTAPPRDRSPSTTGDREILDAENAEVICIVRKRGDPRSSQVLVLDRPSTMLLDQLQRESHPRDVNLEPTRLHDLEREPLRRDARPGQVATRTTPPRTPATPPVTRRSDGPVIRGQSKR